MDPRFYTSMYWSHRDPYSSGGSSSGASAPLGEIDSYNLSSMMGQHNPFAPYRAGLGPGMYSSGLGMGYRLGNPRIHDRWGDMLYGGSLGFRNPGFGPGF
jgi:hypothetical protein